MDIRDIEERLFEIEQEIKDKNYRIDVLTDEISDLEDERKQLEAEAGKWYEAEDEMQNREYEAMTC